MRYRRAGIVIALGVSMIPHSIKMLCISLVAGSLVTGCVGTGKGKSRAYTINAVAAGTTVAGMLLLVNHQANGPSDQLDMGPSLAYAWGGVALATLAALSLVTAQMPDAETNQSVEAGVARLELIPTPISIHLD